MAPTIDTITAERPRDQADHDWAEFAQLALQRIRDAAFDARHGCITVREYREIEL